MPASSSLSRAEVAQRQVAAIKTGIDVKAPNGLRLRHRIVRRLVVKLFVALPWLTAADRPAAVAWCELETLRQRVFADLMTRGITLADGEARTLLREHRQMAATQLAYERELGMTPAARSSMGLAAAASAARVEDAQRRLREKVAADLEERDRRDQHGDADVDRHDDVQPVSRDAA